MGRGTRGGDSVTTITFPRPTRDLPSLNQRQHWARKAQTTSVWRHAAYVFAMNAAGHIEQDPAIVCITYDVPDRRRRDPSNMIGHKPIVDGLVDAGWWPDDTPEYVTVAEPVLRVVKGPLMVTVELRPR